MARVPELWNVYGPTETTIWSTIEKISSTDAPVSIGRPIGNTVIYITDAELKQLPIGASGELLIGGAGVARGYLNRPNSTREILPDPSRTSREPESTGLGTFADSAPTAGFTSSAGTTFR